MTDPIRILAVSGSLRSDSYNTRLLEAAADLAPAGTTVTTFAGLAALEPFDADAEAAASAAVTTWRAALREADAVLIATPEYNASFPGQLKNALDWASRSDTDTPGIAGSALYGTPVAVVSASTGRFGGTWAQEALRKVLGAQGSRVVNGPTVAVAAADDAFDQDGSLSNTATAERLTELLVQLTTTAGKLRTARAAHSAAAHAPA